MFNTDLPKASPIRRKPSDEMGLETTLTSHQALFSNNEKIKEAENENYSPGDYYNYSIKKKSKFDTVKMKRIRRLHEAEIHFSLFSEEGQSSAKALRDDCRQVSFSGKSGSPRERVSFYPRSSPINDDF